MKINNLFLLLFLTILGSCNKTKNETSTEIQIEKSKLDINGVDISYQKCGSADTTLFFIHGWCINQSYWDNQVETFCKDYQIVTMDLAGFGESAKTRTEWTVENYAKDILEMIAKLNLKNVVLIGHSMGGDIILETALQSDKVIALVGVDNFKMVGLEFDEKTKREIEAFQDMLKNNFQETVENYTKNFLLHSSTSADSKERIMNDFMENDSVVAIATMEAVFKYNPKEREKLASLNKKLFLINSDAMPTYIEGLEATGVSFEVMDILSTGHYPMVEKPDEFNELLGQVMSKIHQKVQ